MKPITLSRISATLAAVPILWLLGGCTTTYHITVDSISRPTATEAQSYKIRSKDPTVGEEDLRYKEVEGIVKTALSGKGLFEAPSNVEPDMIVEMEYGIEPPRLRMETVSRPIYVQTGGRVRYVSYPVRDSKGNVTMAVRAVYDPPQNQLVGFEDEARPVVVYEKFLKLSARENVEVSEGRPPPEIWSVHVSTEDESKDLRKYIPILASATIDQIGTTTPEQKSIRIKESDEVVAFVKKGM